MLMKIGMTLLLGLTIAAGAIAGQGKDAAKGAGQPAAFEAFKKLAGDWTGTGQGISANFKVTSGGNTVVETELPGTAGEMITVIHPDGNDLVLTHYCHIGNQPQMRASGKMDGNQVAFKFVKATNLKSSKDMHMREVTYTFVDNNTLKAAWTVYQDEKPGETVVFELKRKK